MVGIDRLAGAVAANVLRGQGLPLVVVDLGTAITVDLVDSAGTFLGGAILPGIGMSARALHEFTDLLPLLNMETLTQPPPAVGASTMHAMQSGLYWGAIGAARELIERFRQFLGQQPQVLLTGGAAASVAALVEPAARYEPHLVLAGIALSVAASIHADR
jgi:type III pantothenate kinase